MSAVPTGRKIPFLDLRVTDPDERQDILDAVARVLDHGRIVTGPEVAEFEERIAAYCGRRFCVGVGTGTDALILGLKSLGIGPGDEVITTPLSWLATGSAILLNGATAVFCDIDQTLNMDPATIEPLITPRTKAIMPVHFTGAVCSMDEIRAIADRHGLLVIEDGSQAFGATFRGKPTGAFGDMACISMNAMKVLGGMGDAGVVLTDDEAIATSLRALRHSGVVDREYCLRLSHNCRLDTVQAAVLLKRLDRLPHLIERRRRIAERYRQSLADVVTLPPDSPDHRHVYYTFPIRSPWRDALKAHLEGHGVETKIQHPVLMNDQPAFQGVSRGTSPQAAVLIREILCIPASEKLTDAEQDIVIETVRSFFEGGGRGDLHLP